VFIAGIPSSLPDILDIFNTWFPFFILFPVHYFLD